METDYSVTTKPEATCNIMNDLMLMILLLAIIVGLGFRYIIEFKPISEAIARQSNLPQQQRAEKAMAWLP